MIKTRFAPSPTGYLHIGGARTALFNWLYARSQGGQFILRIEDTDLNRSRPEYIDEILKSMQWLGMSWDECFYQSRRFDLYREQAKKLIDQDKAYSEGEAVLLKIPQKEIKVYDLIRGEIIFDTAVLKDEVLIKSDGSPTYSFACVVDDTTMGISHVIRGEDHISNTPKQMMIYEALERKSPKFAHLPLIMGEDGARLSKRTGSVAVSDYQKTGFLPQGMMNYLLLLGWSPGQNQEIIPMKQAMKKFSIKKVNKAAAIFSIDKLKWVNAQYIKSKPVEELETVMRSFLIERGLIAADFPQSRLREIIALYHSRMSTFRDFIDRADFFFRDDYAIDEVAAEKYLKEDHQKDFETLAERFSQVEDFHAKNIEDIFRDFVDERQMKSSDLVHPIRVALTGKDVGPGLFETIAVLGKEKTVQRLRQVFTH